MKKIKHIFIILLIATPLWMLADERTPPPPQSSKNSNFSKKSFSNNSNFSKNGAVLTPPSTSSAGSGYASPISGGFLILVIGSTLFLTKRLRDDYKRNQLG